MDEVPLKSIKCGKHFKKQSNCYLILPETSVPRLDFICRDANGEIFKLQCEDITAIDLRVEAKFGSINAMKGTLLVECSVLETNNSTLEKTSNNSCPPSDNGYTAKGCLVRATFHVNETGAVRDLIRKLKGIYSSSNLDKNTNVNHPNNPQTYPKHFKEGLPSWVQYIPHYLYSKRTRRCIQHAIYIYLVFSVMWALWQLYRYVDFVREFVRPLINLLQCQYRLLDYVIGFFNTIFEEYTIQWLCFIKPLYTVTSAMAAPLLQTVTNSCAVLWPIVKPIANIGYQFGYFVFTIIQGLKNALARFWFPFIDISVPYIRAIKHMLSALWQSLAQVQLDPFKAQLVIVRTTVIQSSKAVGFGMVRLVQKVYKVIWLRRSARVEKQE